MFFNFPRIFVPERENVIWIFVKNLINFGKELETNLQCIDINLYIKNILNLKYGLKCVSFKHFKSLFR